MKLPYPSAVEAVSVVRTTFLTGGPREALATVAGAGWSVTHPVVLTLTHTVTVDAVLAILAACTRPGKRGRTCREKFVVKKIKILT